MVRIAKCKVDKIVRDALEVAFPLSGKFGDGDEATSRESDVITPCNEGIFDECDDIISVLRALILTDDEVPKPHYLESVSPTLGEESIRKSKEGVVPDRYSISFIGSERGITIVSLKLKGSDVKEGTLPESRKVRAGARVDGFGKGGRVSAEDRASTFSKSSKPAIQDFFIVTLFSIDIV